MSRFVFLRDVGGEGFPEANVMSFGGSEGVGFPEANVMSFGGSERGVPRSERSRALGVPVDVDPYKNGCGLRYHL